MSKNNVPLPERPEGFEEAVRQGVVHPLSEPSPLEARAEGDTNLSEWRRQWMANISDTETRRLLAEDARLFLHQSLSTPCLDVVEQASGTILRCRSGAEILDFHGNNLHQVGHAHPFVLEAIKKQLDILAFCPRRFTNTTAIQLAERLVQIAPSPLSKVLLCPGGAEAVSMALRLARLATGRYKTVSFWDSFHGATLDTIAVGGERLFREGMEPLQPGALHLPPPVVPPSHRETPAVEAMRDPDYIDYLMRKEGDIGALIAEPFRYSCALHPPGDYWKQVQRICRRHGALLIFDEMPVCLGRTGHWFACELYDVVPDILVIGKGLGGGVFPMAAILADPALDIAGKTALGHFTHEKSPVGSAAALATLQVIEEANLLRQTRCKGKKMIEALLALQQRHEGVGMVSGIGLQLAIECVDASGHPDLERADQILSACLQNGLSFKISGGNVLSLAPPLTVTTVQIRKALAILNEAFENTAFSKPIATERIRPTPPGALVM